MSHPRPGIARAAWPRDTRTGCTCGSARNAVTPDAVTTPRAGTPPRTSAWPGTRLSGRTNRTRTGALQPGSPPVGDYFGRPGADRADRAYLIAGILQPASDAGFYDAVITSA